jgi:hypothetical protein
VPHTKRCAPPAAKADPLARTDHATLPTTTTTTTTIIIIIIIIIITTIITTASIDHSSCDAAGEGVWTSSGPSRPASTSPATSSSSLPGQNVYRPHDAQAVAKRCARRRPREVTAGLRLMEPRQGPSSSGSIHIQPVTTTGLCPTGRRATYPCCCSGALSRSPLLERESLVKRVP